jgi:biopolymer transport protein ExbD
MASVSDSGENKLNVELNLVPFIDLLSSLVLFLLVTAVWLQVGTIPATVESKGKAQVSLTEENHLLIHLTPRGFALTWPKKGNRNLPSQVGTENGHFNFAKLEAVLNLYPKSTTMPLAAVSSEDAVEYGMVIEAIDAAKRSGFTAVGLSVD